LLQAGSWISSVSRSWSRLEYRRSPSDSQFVVVDDGTAADGRLFRTATGGDYSRSAYYRAWETARGYGLPPEIADSPVAGRPYDLRHAGVTLWLNSGMPPPEVARRAGHGVDVLLRIYAGCIDGAESTANRGVDAALAENTRLTWTARANHRTARAAGLVRTPRRPPTQR
jgi:integrase